MQTIAVPKRLDLASTLTFVRRINELVPDDAYCFDFADLSWIYPFGMLFAAQAIKNLKSRNPGCEIRCERAIWEEAPSYAAHMGFFNAFGFSFGNKPGFKAGTNTYIPITYVPAKQLSSRDAIEEISLELARQLTMEDSGILVDALTYSFREMIRNVIEHSQSTTLAYCAQYWPAKGSVELAILDTGIGLRNSLSQNPNLPMKSDQDAIKYALMPGVSGKIYEGVKPSNDVWQNSGYGLYMNYRLCNEGGNFFICSGDRGLYRTSGNDNLYYETTFQGTALRLRLDTKNLSNISLMLKRFGDEGEIVARGIGLGAIPKASTMSRMLKDNFKIDYQIEIGDTVRHRQFGEGTVTEKKAEPQGEMLWVAFNGGRKKKVLSKDVMLINEDTFTYVRDTIEMYETVEDLTVISITDEYPDDASEDSFFDF